MSFTNPKPESVEKNALINVLHMALQDNDEHVIKWFTSKLQSYWPRFSDEVIKDAHNNIFFPEDEDDEYPEDFDDDSSAVINRVYMTSTNKKFKVLQAQTGNDGNVSGYAIEWLDSKQRDFMSKDTFDNALRTGGIKEESEDDHFGEEQAEGLDSLLEGLRDTPHDNRW